jgi:hypothetical protein
MSVDETWAWFQVVWSFHHSHSYFLRFGTETVKSRAGLEQQADILINSSTDLMSHQPASKIHCVLVDECQFLDPFHIDQLREITFSWNVPVICYGLRTDFRTHLFPASKRSSPRWDWNWLTIGYSSSLIPSKKWRPLVTSAIRRQCTIWSMSTARQMSADLLFNLALRRNISQLVMAAIETAYWRRVSRSPALSSSNSFILVVASPMSHPPSGRGVGSSQRTREVFTCSVIK